MFSYSYEVLYDAMSQGQKSVNKSKFTTVLIISLLHDLLRTTTRWSGLVPLNLTSDGSGDELGGVGVGEETLGVSLEVGNGEASSGVG